MNLTKTNLIVGRTQKFMNIEVTWWGKLQWYKFRWYKDHIDLGVISFYNLPQQGIGYLFWRLVSILIKPLRWWYHRRFIYRTKAQIRNIEWEMNFYNKEVNG